MSDDSTSYLNRRVADLERELAETRAESKKHRLAKRDLQKQMEEVSQGFKALDGEHKALKERALAAPGTLAAEVERLKGEIRTRDHKDAWSSIKDQLNEKVSVEKVWAEIGYQPGDTPPTPDQIKEQLGKAREAAPYLFKPAGETPAPAPGGAQQPPARLNVGLEAGRGAPDTRTEKLYVRKSQLQDPGYAMSNSKSLGEAAKAGNLVILEG